MLLISITLLLASSPTQFDALKPKTAPVPKIAAKTTAPEKKPTKKNEKPAKKQLPSLQTVVGNVSLPIDGKKNGYFLITLLTNHGYEMAKTDASSSFSL